MKNGVPFDIAFALEPAERLAYTVILAGFEGNEFDWVAMRFVERNT